mgnify:CR=1 FL=1
MLTEKQLQALIDCEEKEDCTGETCPIFEICDNDYTNKVAAEAAQTALAYREMLEQAEEVLKSITRCPCCWGVNTHSEKCEIQKIIEAITKLLESEG